MTPEEYEAYTNMAGKEEYSIASTSTGVDVEEEDAKADENEEWYDAEVNPQEVKHLKEDQEKETVLQVDDQEEPKEKKGNTNSVRKRLQWKLRWGS